MHMRPRLPKSMDYGCTWHWLAVVQSDWRSGFRDLKKCVNSYQPPYPRDEWVGSGHDTRLSSSWHYRCCIIRKWGACTCGPLQTRKKPRRQCRQNATNTQNEPGLAYLPRLLRRQLTSVCTSIFGTTFSRQSFNKIPGASQHHCNLQMVSGKVF